MKSNTRRRSQRAAAAAAAVAGLVLSFSPAGASAADYVVSTTGNDSASGTAGAPWRTLQRVWRTVQAGDTVTVEDGTYAGFACDGSSGTSASRIVIRSRNRWGAKITSASPDSAEDFVQLNSCSHITVDGFEVSGAPRSGIAILGNNDDGSDARGVIVQNNYAHNNGTRVAGRHDGVFSGFALDLTVQDNRIDFSGEHGIYVSNAADNPAILRNQVTTTGNNCIQINADLSTGGDGLISGWRIEGNVVRDCRGSAGFNLDGAIRGVAQNNVIYNAAKGGITLFQGDGAEASHSNLIVNNTVYNPTGSRAALQVASGANNNIVFNNIFITQSTGLEVQSVTGLVHDHNIISSYSGTTASANESNQAASALFMAPSTGDLRLLATAAAVDRGVASLGGMMAPGADVLGAPRPFGAAYDIGAYEHGAMAPSTGAGGSGAGGSTTGAGGASGANGLDGGTSSGAGGNHPGNGGAGGSTAGGGASGAGGTGSTPADGGPGAGVIVGNGCGCSTADTGAGGQGDLLLAGLLLILGSLLLAHRHRGRA